MSTTPLPILPPVDAHTFPSDCTRLSIHTYIHTSYIPYLPTYLPTYIHLFLHPPTTSLFISTFDTHRILFFLDLPSYLGIKAFAFILKHTIIKHTASAYLFYFSFIFYYFSIHFLPLFPRSPRNHTKQKKTRISPKKINSNDTMAPTIDVTDIGTMPYPTVRTILLQVNSARQLRQLEEASPQLEGDDAECWVRLIGRDFPVLSKRHNFAPKNPASWHLIYARYERLEADQKREAEAKLKAAFAGIKNKKAENVSQIINFDRRRLPHPPKDGRGGGGGVRKPGAGSKRPDDGDLRFTGGTRTKTTTGQGILRKARREAREISARNRLATPTGLLPVRQGQIVSAPKAMVEDERIKAQPAIRGADARASSGGVLRSGASELRRNKEMEEREERLRRLKSASAANAGKGATVVSDSDLEDEDGGFGGDDRDNDDDDYDLNDRGNRGGLDANDLENLFDEKPSSSSKPSSSRKVSLAPMKPATRPTTPAALLSSSSKPTKPSPMATATASTSTIKRSGILTNAPGSTRKARPVPVPVSRPRSGSTSNNNHNTNSKATSASVSPSSTTSYSTQQKKAFSPSSSPPAKPYPPHPQQYQSSPPAAATTSAGPASSASPELKPQAPPPLAAARKRKPVDIFMKPKPKVQKR